jgi:hypothetical protein
VAPSLFQPGLAALKAQFDPKPNIGESRLMMSPYSAQQLFYGPAPDIKDNILLNRSVFLANLNLLDNLPKVDGFFSLNLRESDKVLWLLDSRSGPKLDSLEDLLSVSQTIAPGKVFDWMPRTNYIPIVSFGQAPIFADDENAFDAIEKGTVDFHSVVYLPVEARGRVHALGEKHARLINKNFTTTKVSLEVETPAPTVFVIAQAYYHNWEATVDGVPAPLWRANYAFQAIEAPAGKHRILLVYKDKALRVGSAISVASILACMIGWVRMRKKTGGGRALLFTTT